MLMPYSYSKTDWKNGDKVSWQEYMRIHDNLQSVYEMSVSFFGTFPIEKVYSIDELVVAYPQDSKYVTGSVTDQMRYMARFALANTFNPIEHNIQTIIDIIGRPDGFYTGKTYYENTLKLSAVDMNNIEASIETMKSILDRMEQSNLTLAFTLQGTFKGSEF